MFSMSIEIKNGISIVRFHGDLTSDNIKLLKEDLLSTDKGLNHFLFDLEKLELLDSTGLSYLINCLKYSMKNNTEIKILHLDNQPKVVFEITRVNTLFELYDNEKEALNSFKEHNNESNHSTAQHSA